MEWCGLNTVIIVKHPDTALRQQSSRVDVFDDELVSLVSEMVETMYVERGVGLAAPQVGVNKRIVVIDPSCGERAHELLVMVNPVILQLSDDRGIAEEGCLSLPGKKFIVIRSDTIVVEYVGVSGTRNVLECHGDLARIVQHEIDHLDGIIISDRAVVPRRRDQKRFLRLTT